MILTNAQRELRAVKREISTAERTGRADSRDKQQQLRSTTGILGSLAGTDARRILRTGQTVGRRAMRQQDAGAATTYRRAKDDIEKLTSQLATAKVRISSTPKSTAVPADPAPSEPSEPADTTAGTDGPPPPPAPPGWAADPFDRFEERYWDGSTWTEHVRSGEAPAVDPPQPD